MRELWRDTFRPGYFGRRRDEKIATLNRDYGEGNWRLVWRLDDIECTFEVACLVFYEASYFVYLKNRPEDLAFICSHREVIDNAITNVQSGFDYTKQEAFSTHIQDIAIRNVVHRLGRAFSANPAAGILTVRSADSNGARFGPGVVPFFAPNLLLLPSLRPRWANEGSVEDFWQSNKWVQVKEKADD